jgi:hypothetical protein
VAVVGSARVGTTDLNSQLRLDALHEAGATRTYADDGVSGATSETLSAAKLTSTPGTTRSSCRATCESLTYSMRTSRLGRLSPLTALGA